VSTDIRDLYREVIVDHSKRPRNFRPLEGANRKVEGFNPLCGDKITIYLKIENDKVADISFVGSGCANLDGLRVAAHREPERQIAGRCRSRVRGFP